VFAFKPLSRARSWTQSSPGLPAGPDIGNRPEDKSPVPSTMSYQHGPGDPPGDPNANAGLPTPSVLTHPHGFSTTANASLLRPQTSSPSLIPSDVHHDKAFLERCRDHFTALCERLKSSEESHKD